MNHKPAPRKPRPMLHNPNAGRYAVTAIYTYSEAERLAFNLCPSGRAKGTKGTKGGEEIPSHLDVSYRRHSLDVSTAVREVMRAAYAAAAAEHDRLLDLPKLRWHEEALRRCIDKHIHGNTDARDPQAGLRPIRPHPLSRRMLAAEARRQGRAEGG